MALPRNPERRDLNTWSDRTGYTVEILKAAIRRGELAAERPSGFERGRLYVSSEEMERWLTAIQVSAEDAS